ncbi:MAG TPA: hypothetical protein VMV69_29560 [Pirellulales bacterium]|nr:hypothetical protein [Pirellulales bacterium]
MGLPGCRSRKALACQGDLFACLNPRIHAPQGVVSSAVCATCDCREEPTAGECSAPHGECPAANDDQAQAARGRRHVTRWAVGVTTAPRARPTLDESLDSLHKAGWGRPRLFAEPCTVLPECRRDLPVSRRDGKLGAFSNWYLGLTELFLREPLADAYLMCQDDAIFAVGARDYLEQNLWPGTEVGVVSIYTPSHWSKAPGVLAESRGFHHVRHGWESWGALAYVFPNRSLRALLVDPLFVNHRHHGAAEGQRNIDSVVGAWCESAGLAYYIHMPSLVQHIGDTSTIWKSASASGPRRAADFVEHVGWAPPTTQLGGRGGVRQRGERGA